VHAFIKLYLCRVYGCEDILEKFKGCASGQGWHKVLITEIFGLPIVRGIQAMPYAIYRKEILKPRWNEEVKMPRIIGVTEVFCIFSHVITDALIVYVKIMSLNAWQVS
jgi:hypothetical protein